MCLRVRRGRRTAHRRGRRRCRGGHDKRPAQVPVKVLTVISENHLDIPTPPAGRSPGQLLQQDEGQLKRQAGGGRPASRTWGSPPSPGKPDPRSVKQPRSSRCGARPCPCQRPCTTGRLLCDWSAIRGSSRSRIQRRGRTWRMRFQGAQPGGAMPIKNAWCRPGYPLILRIIGGGRDRCQAKADQHDHGTGHHRRKHRPYIAGAPEVDDHPHRGQDQPGNQDGAGHVGRVAALCPDSCHRGHERRRSAPGRRQLPVNDRRNMIVATPDISTARFGLSPIIAGNTNVAPNIATTCWAPRPAIAATTAAPRGGQPSPAAGSGHHRQASSPPRTSPASPVRSPAPADKQHCRSVPPPADSQRYLSERKASRPRNQDPSWLSPGPHTR